jgi:A/G-specific adenine glycosylase
MGAATRTAFEGRLFDAAAFLSPKPSGERLRQDFRELVLGHYEAAGRAFPWRETRDPWAILVSEVMLQQTQTDRVLPKYQAFMAAFPTPAALAASSLERLLALWSGLGYNRRALSLRRAALELAARAERGGPDFPRDAAGLESLPGVGPYTSRAILAFAFDEPTAFIETNIRSVFLFHFFPGESGVADARILPLVEASMDSRDPRTWYYALMDYGVFLKRRHGNPNARSAHYAKQESFANSNRRVRGAVLREIGEAGVVSLDDLAARLPFARERVAKAVNELAAEGFIAYRGESLRIGDR